MICPKCRTENDETYRFCQECGMDFLVETQAAYPSIEVPTVIAPSVLPVGNIVPPPPAVGKPSKLPYILLAVLSVVLLGILAYLFVPAMLNKKTILPDRFGIFHKKDDRLTELHSRKFTNLLKARDELKEDSSLPVAESNPNLIINYNEQTIPSKDLMLIKLDTIKDDGNVKHWYRDIAEIEENSKMRQVKVPSSLPTGRYALALLKGHLDDGAHELWAFQVENGAENSPEAQNLALSLKPTPAPTPTPQVIPKPTTPQKTKPETTFSGQTGICNTDDVIVRDAPILADSTKTKRRLRQNEPVEILQYSSEFVYDPKTQKTDKFVQIRRANGQIGWVFGYYLR